MSVSLVRTVLTCILRITVPDMVTIPMSVLIIIFLILCPECWAVSNVLSCGYVCVDHYLPYPLSWVLSCVWRVELRLWLCWSLSPYPLSWVLSRVWRVDLRLRLCWSLSSLSSSWVLSCAYRDELCLCLCWYVDLYLVPYSLCWVLSCIWHVELHLCLCWSLSSSLSSVLSVELCLTCWSTSLSVLIFI